MPEPDADPVEMAAMERPDPSPEDIAQALPVERSRGFSVCLVEGDPPHIPMEVIERIAGRRSSGDVVSIPFPVDYIGSGEVNRNGDALPPGWLRETLGIHPGEVRGAEGAVAPPPLEAAETGSLILIATTPDEITNAARVNAIRVSHRPVQADRVAVMQVLREANPALYAATLGALDQIGVTIGRVTIGNVAAISRVRFDMGDPVVRDRIHQMDMSRTLATSLDLTGDKVPPIHGIPEGCKVRVRIRVDSPVRLFLRFPTHIEEHYVVKRPTGIWLLGPTVAVNGTPPPVPVTEQPCDVECRTLIGIESTNE